MRVVWLTLVAACSYAPRVGDVDGDAPVAIDTGGVDAFVCPTGYTTLSGAPATSLYKVFGADGGTPSPSPGRATWELAHAACVAEGAGVHLAIAQTETEYAALSDAVSGASRWLGVSDRIVDGDWLPIVGGTEADFIGHWFGSGASAPPANGNTNNCMLLTRVVDNTGPMLRNLAEATPCRGEGSEPEDQWDKGYICECDMRAVDTSTL